MESIIKIILWVIRQSNTQQDDKITQIPRQWGIKNTIMTPYGYEVDEYPYTSQLIDKIFKYIPISDGKPTYNPTNYDLDSIHTRIPVEANKYKSLIDFINTNGGFLLKPEGEYMVIDLSEYEKYSVRPEFYKYGGKIYIKNDQIIKYVYLKEEYPSDSIMMEHIIKASLCLKIMVELHAIRIHICTVQRKTIEYMKKYTESSDIFDLLYLLTYGTLKINRNVNVLISPYGLFGRLYGLTTESYNDLITEKIHLPPLSISEIVPSNDTQWSYLMTKYINIVKQFVGKYMGEDDPRYTQICDFFVISTAAHNQFGDAEMYTMAVSGFFITKVYINNPGFISEVDKQILDTLLVSVSNRFPCIDDPSLNVLFKNHEKDWIEFTDQIKSFPSTNWFNPSYFETSVSF